MTPKTGPNRQRGFCLSFSLSLAALHPFLSLTWGLLLEPSHHVLGTQATWRGYLWASQLTTQLDPPGRASINYQICEQQHSDDDSSPSLEVFHSRPQTLVE